MLDITGYTVIKTIDGDSFDKLALEFYNNEKLASLIIGQNPDYCSTLIFGAGVELRIPNVANTGLPESLPPWRRGQ